VLWEGEGGEGGGGGPKKAGGGGGGASMAPPSGAAVARAPLEESPRGGAWSDAAGGDGAPLSVLRGP